MRPVARWWWPGRAPSARVREDYEAVRAKSTGGDVLEPVLAPAESIVLTLEP